ncbi:hypothetical protein AJ80_02917 [Polytolypa hystricis UAMH7299]|uniref:C2H2-type domain-containing protein n=1 Tax=Polytolypa hystricis (strain UAMH7299) TaxID=1447883 RepID=A0A2B7YQ59_POLH7|nr:hypothetical protein AJ80_02917 [Polytolypa hystricis UAMH7299]
MPPRGFTNPAPKTDSARSALTSFTCTLCSKSYSRHPEYEAHISSYDHQHKKRLRDLKQLSRDPNAAERARRAERKADAEAGLRVVDTGPGAGAGVGQGKSGSSAAGGGGFKKGGFKSSFAAVGAAAGAQGGAQKVVRKNVLGDEDEDDYEGAGAGKVGNGKEVSAPPGLKMREQSGLKGRSEGGGEEGESETDDEYLDSGYYDPRRPTDCFEGCAGAKVVAVG